MSALDRKIGELTAEVKGSRSWLQDVSDEVREHGKKLAEMEQKVVSHTERIEKAEQWTKTHDNGVLADEKEKNRRLRNWILMTGGIGGAGALVVELVKAGISALFGG